MTFTSKLTGAHSRRRYISAAAFVITLVTLTARTELAFAQRVYGKIGEKFSLLGGPGGPLGAATTDEADAPHGGRFNSFRNGFIYWHPQLGTAYGVWGAIGTKWNQSGRVQFGYPITDESGTPDGRGRFNHFRAMHVPGRPEASIYWTPQTGAWTVIGAIRAAWAGAGWERSIGYPTSDEFQWGGHRRSNFEQGYITWAPNEGARIVRSGEAILSQTPPGTFGSILVTGLELALDNRVYAGNSTILSENTLCAEYERRRGEIAEFMKNTIRAEANPRMGGFSIRSDARMELSASCSFRADVATISSNSVRLRTYLPGNSFKFHVTTPSIFGSWADPEFSITSDIWAETVLSVPTTPAGSFSAGPTRVFMSAPRLDSHNVTGDVLLALKEAYRFVTGDDLTARLTQSRAFEYQGLRAALADLTPHVRRIPGNYRIETIVAAGNQLRINGTGRPAPPPAIVR